jgi:hypothetical protein
MFIDTAQLIWLMGRFIIEDGKLNLCLRNLIEYKEFQRQKWIARESVDVSEWL